MLYLFLMYSKVIQIYMCVCVCVCVCVYAHIYMYIFFIKLFSIMIYHNILNIVPCAIQLDLVFLFYI